LGNIPEAKGPRLELGTKYAVTAVLFRAAVEKCLKLLTDFKEVYKIDLWHNLVQITLERQQMRQFQLIDLVVMPGV
jgi:hypothetical protein